jgi:glycosyltransferase involved in cell wall biosynthesis
MQVERTLTDRFDLVTTISKADQDRLRSLARAHPESISVIKNGVDPKLLNASTRQAVESRSIVFWGNLAFPPNSNAVRHFYHNVFRPYLEQRGIRWVIIGGNAGPDLTELADRSPQVQFAGFVDDLPAHVSRFPVMVNPMVSGSGLKNKVLEAFALRRAVVSTSMGAEAIEAVADTHYLQADEPETMAEQILSLLDDESRRQAVGDAAFEFVNANYRWETIGLRFHELILEVEQKSALGHEAP